MQQKENVIDDNVSSISTPFVPAELFKRQSIDDSSSTFKVDESIYVHKRSINENVKSFGELILDLKVKKN